MFEDEAGFGRINKPKRCWCSKKSIALLHIPPYTPEMNPIEQIWKQLRSMGFKNEIFKTLKHVVDRLCDTICKLSNDTVRSITARQWIIDAVFN